MVYEKKKWNQKSVVQNPGRISVGGRAREPGECLGEGGGGVQGDLEEESHEALSEKRTSGAEEIFGRESPEKLDKPPACCAAALGPAVLALSA